MATTPRFLTLADVAEVLQTSSAQVYALVRRGELPAIKIGGRGQWRVEGTQLEAYIERMYDQTRAFVDTHPFTDAEDDAEDDAGAEDPEDVGVSEAPGGAVG
jgi:excisionase family DNA binding protein